MFAKRRIVLKNNSQSFLFPKTIYLKYSNQNHQKAYSFTMANQFLNENVNTWENKVGKETKPEDNQLRDLLRSVVFGLFVGDCLGSTSEFKKPR
jgi:hypothetical protein